MSLTVDRKKSRSRIRKLTKWIPSSRYILSAFIRNLRCWQVMFVGQIHFTMIAGTNRVGDEALNRLYGDILTSLSPYRNSMAHKSARFKSRWMKISYSSSCMYYLPIAENYCATMLYRLAANMERGSSRPSSRTVTQVNSGLRRHWYMDRSFSIVVVEKNDVN